VVYTALVVNEVLVYIETSLYWTIGHDFGLDGRYGRSDSIYVGEVMQVLCPGVGSVDTLLDTVWCVDKVQAWLVLWWASWDGVWVTEVGYQTIGLSIALGRVGITSFATIIVVITGDQVHEREKKGFSVGNTESIAD